MTEQTFNVDRAPPINVISQEKRMKIQINTDSHSRGTEARAAHLSAEVEQTLAHWDAQITRVEIHLSDENGSKNGQLDQRCMLEARIEGRQPVVVTDHAATIRQAVHGAARKMAHLLGSTLGRLHEHRKNPSAVITPTTEPGADLESNSGSGSTPH